MSNQVLTENQRELVRNLAVLSVTIWRVTSLIATMTYNASVAAYNAGKDFREYVDTLRDENVIEGHLESAKEKVQETVDKVETVVQSVVNFTQPIVNKISEFVTPHYEYEEVAEEIPAENVDVE